MMPPTVHPFLWGLLNGADGAHRSLPLPEEAAWETIISDATQQGFMPLLYRCLKESGSDRKLPRSAIDRIKTSAFQLAARNITLAQELTSILRLFESRHVACAPIRGLALAELLYSDITARPMGDIDLLVRKEDLPIVADALRELGFREMNRQPGFAQTYTNTLEFVKERQGWIIVEPHWTIAYPPFTDRIDMAALWKRCARGRVVGVDTWLPDRTDLLVHLCFHLIHRGESAPLLWYYEIARLIRLAQPEIEWAQIVRVANESSLELFVSEVLSVLQARFGSPVPDEILSQLKTNHFTRSTHSVGRLLEHRLMRLLAGDSRADGRESLALFFTIKGLGAKTRYATALLFPSSEFMRLHYGLSSRWQVGLRYLTRVMYLAWEGFKGLGGLLFGAGGGDRTRTGRLAHGILSPGRLPIPPPRQTPSV